MFQVVFTNTSGRTSAAGVPTTITTYTQQHSSVTSPSAYGAHFPHTWSLKPYIEGFEWKKCGDQSSSCSSSMSRSQSLDVLLNKPHVWSFEAVVQTPILYVDRRTFTIVFTLRDAYGSPYFLQGTDLQIVMRVLDRFRDDCKGAIGNTANENWLEHCTESQISDSHFTFTTTSAQVQVNATLDGEVNSWMGNVILQGKPFWYHEDLTKADTIIRSWPLLHIPTTPVIVTVPTYPLFPNDAFSIRVYNHESYKTDNGRPQRVKRAQFRLVYNALKVTYTGYSSLNFDVTVIDDNPQDNGFTRKTLQFVQKDTSTVDLNAFFHYITLNFALQSGCNIDEECTDSISIEISSVTTDTPQPKNVVLITTGVLRAQVYDHRNTSNEHVSVIVNNKKNLKMFLNPVWHYPTRTRDMGRIFNYANIDGVQRDHLFTGTVVDNTHGGLSFSYNALREVHLNCGPSSNSETHDIQTKVDDCTQGRSFNLCPLGQQRSRCNIIPVANAPIDVEQRMLTATSSEKCLYDDPTFVALVQSIPDIQTSISVGTVTVPSIPIDVSLNSVSACSASIPFHIISPTVDLSVTDTVLNKIVDGACGPRYQKAQILVSVNGLDVTSLATGLTIGTTSTANLSISKREVQGNMVGDFTLKLFTDSTTKISLSVVDTLVSLTLLKAYIITDVEWSPPSPPSTPFSSFTPFTLFTSGVTLKHKFDEVPTSSSRGSYGYLFVQAMYNDNTTAEDVASGELIISENISPNVRILAPGSDEGIFYNTQTNRYLIYLSSTASEECVDGQIVFNFSHCGTTIGQVSPIVDVDLPFVRNISFKIFLNDKKLTPTNGAASLVPFNGYTTTQAGFELKLEYSTGAQSENYANEIDNVPFLKIVYYPDDLECVDVDNSQNKLTIKEGATCTSITIRVNVTINGQLFQEFDTADVVRLDKVITKVSPYPQGAPTTDSHYIYPLPCLSNIYERLQLSSTAFLTDHYSETVTSQMTYRSNDSLVATINSNEVHATSSPQEGTVEIGTNYSEYTPGSYSDGQSIQMIPSYVTLKTSPPTYDNFDGTSWIIPGTLNKVINGTYRTQYRLQYSRYSVTFIFQNVFSSYFENERIVKFSSDLPQVIDVSESGLLTLRANHYEQVVLRSFLCDVDTSLYNTTPSLFANLRPGDSDVDFGTSLGIRFSGDSETGAPFGDLTIDSRLHLALKVPEGFNFVTATITYQFFNASGQQVFPIIDASSFVSNLDSLKYTPAVYKDLLGIIKTNLREYESNYVYIGYFHNLQTIDFVSVSLFITELVYVQQGTAHLTGSDIKEVDFNAIAGTADVSASLLGSSRRLEEQKHRRKLSVNDCPFAYGDLDGDCKLKGGDVTLLNVVSSRRQDFQFGTTSVDPLNSVQYMTGSKSGQNISEFTKRQYTPTFQLMTENVNHPAYNSQLISGQEAIFLSDVMGRKKPVIEPFANCLTSEISDRPDLVIDVDVYIVENSQDPVLVKATPDKVDVFAQILIAGDNSNTNVLLNVTNGTLIKERNGIVINSTTYSGTPSEKAQETVVVQAAFDTDRFTVRIHPFNYVGDIDYYIALAVETKEDRDFSNLLNFASWSAVSFPPYSDTFVPLYGSPLSMISRLPLTCPDAFPPPSAPPPSAPPPCYTKEYSFQAGTRRSFSIDVNASIDLRDQSVPVNTFFYANDYDSGVVYHQVRERYADTGNVSRVLVFGRNNDPDEEFFLRPGRGYDVYSPEQFNLTVCGNRFGNSFTRHFSNENMNSFGLTIQTSEIPLSELQSSIPIFTVIRLLGFPPRYVQRTENGFSGLEEDKKFVLERGYHIELPNGTSFTLNYVV